MEVKEKKKALLLYRTDVYFQADSNSHSLRIGNEIQPIEKERSVPT